MNADTPAPTAAGDEPWRATGLEAPVFADPSGRRALTMSGIGLAMAATTLAALAIVVTAAIGFARLPGSLPLPVPHVLSARTPRRCTASTIIGSSPSSTFVPGVAIA